MHLAGSLLQLRGESMSDMPIVDPWGNVLIFNGEVYGGLEIHASENDGQILSNALSYARNDTGKAPLFM